MKLLSDACRAVLFNLLGIALGAFVLWPISLGVALVALLLAGPLAALAGVVVCGLVAWAAIHYVSTP